jgi:hypothetical protein
VQREGVRRILCGGHRILPRRWGAVGSFDCVRATWDLGMRTGCRADLPVKRDSPRIPSFGWGQNHIFEEKWVPGGSCSIAGREMQFGAIVGPGDLLYRSFSELPSGMEPVPISAAEVAAWASEDTAAAAASAESQPGRRKRKNNHHRGGRRHGALKLERAERRLASEEEYYGAQRQEDLLRDRDADDEDDDAAPTTRLPLVVRESSAPLAGLPPGADPRRHALSLPEEYKRPRPLPAASAPSTPAFDEESMALPVRAVLATPLEPIDTLHDYG